MEPIDASSESADPDVAFGSLCYAPHVVVAQSIFGGIINERTTIKSGHTVSVRAYPKVSIQVLEQCADRIVRQS